MREVYVELVLRTTYGRLQSGTGEIAESAEGKYATETVYSDLNIDQLKAIPPTAFHRDVDLAVIGADEQGNC